MEWNLHQQQNHQKTREKTKSQFLKKNTKLVSDEIVSADGF